MQTLGKEQKEIGAINGTLGNWLSNPAIEMLPNATSMRSLSSIPPETDHSVTNLPSDPIDTTTSFSLNIAREGRSAVPHIAASRLSRGKALEVGAVLGEYSVGHVFVMNGDSDGSSATYASSLDLLEDLYSSGATFNKIGVVGHPEGHRSVTSQILDQALADKQEFAEQTGTEMYIVTQMCFDPSAIAGWIKHIRGEGVHLPVIAGLPGPIATSKLAAYSEVCGVGDSIQALEPSAELPTEQGSDTQPTFNPYRFLQKLAAEVVDQNEVQGLYFYTFNEPQETQKWIDRVREGIQF